MSNLHDARKNKQDEFYTAYEDIENELTHYKHHLENKIVYCNADDARVSNFFKYFKDNFSALKLKRLIATCYINQTPSLFDYTHNPAICCIYDGDTASYKNLRYNGDFRNVENIELLKQADIIVTNPPFSLFREYVAQLMQYNKKFLIIGNMNAITYKEFFPLIKENKVWLGVTGRGNEYQVPDEYELYSDTARIDDDGNKYLTLGNTCWFTNLKHDFYNEKIVLDKKYNAADYPHYDNYDAIEVSKTRHIPSDWGGVMGVPISFLHKYNPEQFSILGSSQKACSFDVMETRNYDDYWEVRQNGEKTGASGKKTNGGCVLVRNNGKNNYFTNGDKIVQCVYQRIFICRR